MPACCYAAGVRPSQWVLLPFDADQVCCIRYLPVMFLLLWRAVRGICVWLSSGQISLQACQSRCPMHQQYMVLHSCLQLGLLSHATDGSKCAARYCFCISLRADHILVLLAGARRFAWCVNTSECATPAEKNPIRWPDDGQQHCHQHHRGAGVRRGHQGGAQGRGFQLDSSHLCQITAGFCSTFL